MPQLTFQGPTREIRTKIHGKACSTIDFLTFKEQAVTRHLILWDTLIWLRKRWSWKKSNKHTEQTLVWLSRELQHWAFWKGRKGQSPLVTSWDSICGFFWASWLLHSAPRREERGVGTVHCRIDRDACLRKSEASMCCERFVLFGGCPFSPWFEGDRS